MNYATAYNVNGTINLEAKSLQEDICWQEYAHDWEWDFYRKAYRCREWPADVRRWLRNDPLADYEEIVIRGED